MNKQHSMRFAARPLSAAILMALATPAAFAAVTATQLPGVGYVVSGSSVTSGVAGNTLTVTNASNTTPIIIQWGGTAPAVTAAATINGTGTAGFNIGQSATTVFSAASAAPILNVDATGNPSQILGTLTVSGASAASSPVFVANANGIVVGAGSVITAPGGLGLINADLSSTQAQAVFESGAVPVSFQGATGGVQINAGADLSAVGNELLVAGAGNVNVQGAFVSHAGHTVYSIPGASTGVTVMIDAGIGGYVTPATPIMGLVVQDSGAAQTFGSLSTSNYNTNFSYRDAVNSSITLNLGTTQSPYAMINPTTGMDGTGVFADGNISNEGNVALVWNGNANAFEWINGTFTNTGTLNFGRQTGSTLTSTTSETWNGSTAFLGNPTAGSWVIYGNTTQPLSAGSFVNATGGLINAGSLAFTGAAFSNFGTIQMGQSATSVPSLDVTETSGNINISGTVSVVSGDGVYSGPFFLNGLELNAASTAGQSVTVNTATPLLVSGGSSVTIAATNVNLGSSLTVSGGDFIFSPYSVTNANAAPVSGSFVLASGATLSATNLYLGSSGATNPGPAYTSYKINGSMVATGTSNTPGKALLGDSITSTSNKASVFNVSGAGSITAGTLTFNNLLGSVNNITTGQILANGFRVNAPTANGQPGTVNITVTAVGAAPQGFNVFIVGNATINSGDTVAVNTQAPAGNEKYAQYLYPANANSNLVVSANGSLTVNAGTGADNYGLGTALFQWPGLVYMAAGSGNLTATAAIANAYGAQAATGHAGVFFIANNITDSFPIYTNGNAGVVFAAPPLTGVLWAHLQAYYPYALSINGVNPFTGNPGLPTVYFATPNPTVANANFSFQVLNSFTNGRGYQQENQIFLTLP
ncbi:hypothetical protein HF289_03340 [Acidithiobacillus ferrooxidans]|uniref:beta strand repeat-containing protein n=1 Tax=Acidithiobacillus ferrooxidans TaxID=920 RepID=UPI001C0794C1|nr:hypothetical protein [Acidithiobacillus ferrooxidans]MBU2855946.1 hypothetical protein [Acidithiobacillus ferrooxidans]